ncbi:MAG: hypothetical protein ACC654_03015 [Acidimicrobiia bacterium]
MIDIETQKETLTNVAKAVTDSTVTVGTKAKDYGTATAKAVADGTVTVGTKAKDYSTSTVKSVAEHKLVVRFMGLGGTATSNATAVAKDVFEKAQTATGKGVEKVSELPLGEKNVGEMAQSTVDTVQEKIDVDQIQDQVSKLREQIEGVLSTWKESFRPATPSKEDTKVEEKSADKAVKATKKATPKKKATTAKASSAKKVTTTKASAAKKTTTPKASSTKKATAAKK